MKFFPMLREIRKENNLTQAELAKALKIGQRTVSSYESGEREPLASSLITYADYFNVSVDYLIGRADEFGNITIVSPPANSPTGEQLTPQEKKLLDEYRQLTYSNRLYVETYVSVRLEEQNGKTNTKHA